MRGLYELVDQGESRDIVPRLRLWVEDLSFLSTSSISKVVAENVHLPDDANVSAPFESPISLPTVTLPIPIESQDVSPMAEVAFIMQHEVSDDNVVDITSPVTQRPNPDFLVTTGMPEHSSNSCHATIDDDVTHVEDDCIQEESHCGRYFRKLR